MTTTAPALPRWSEPQVLWLALALSAGAALSLGITRFAYGLLLPTMRADLGWSYTLAGAMNTVNAPYRSNQLCTLAMRLSDRAVRRNLRRSRRPKP